MDYPKIIELVAEKYDITPYQLLGRSRIKYYVTARSEAANILRNDIGLTYSKIGVILGGRDHTTVINLLRHYKKMQSIISIREENYERVVKNLEHGLSNRN